jgi:lysophospholipase L1-like esterase
MTSRNISKKILAVFISLIVFFFLGELLIRIYLRYNTVYDIEMTRYALYNKVDSDNPRIGHEHKPGSSMRLMNVAVGINSDGLRDREYPAKKGDNYRIIVLGDSLTFGWGVAEQDTFSNILEENLNKSYPTEIINFGTGNYNTEQEVNLFKEKGLKYKPDKVVLFYFINDAEATPKKSKLWFLGYSEFISFYWSRINSLMDKYSSSQSFGEYYSALYRDDQAGWKNTKSAILELKQICGKENIQLQVVLLPELHDTKNQVFREVYDSMANFLSGNNIEYVNLATLFKEQDNQMDLWVSYDDAHPNATAHKRIAESITEFISERKR